VGFALAGYNASGILLEEKKPWEHIFTVIITAAGILGLLIGALVTSRIIEIGRWRAALLANSLVILSCVPMMFLNVYTHILGRLLLGFAGGMNIVVCAIFMAETVPADKIGATATSINFGIVTGLLLTTLI
jgi:MFS family permease